MSGIFGIIKLLNNIWDAIRGILNAIASWQQKRRDEAQAEKQAGLDDAAAATTPEEAYAAQERINRGDP